MNSISQKYSFGQLLGVGSSAEVHEACLVEEVNINTRDYYPFAVKIIQYDHRMNDFASMATELEILKNIQHLHIIRLVEAVEEVGTLYLVMEKATDGDLINGIARLPRYTESFVREVFHQLTDAVQYLHNLGIVHRDIKLSNILYHIFNNQIVIKLTDFGVSVFLKASVHHDEETSQTTFYYDDTQLFLLTGTRPYFAPEVYARAYGRPADMWSLGCILVELLTGQVAFASPELPHSFWEKIQLFFAHRPLRKYEKLSEWSKVSSNTAKDLVSMLLEREPCKRLTASECLRHPFVVSLPQQLSSSVDETTFSQGRGIFGCIPNTKVSSENSKKCTFACSSDSNQDLNFAHHNFKLRQNRRKLKMPEF